MLSKFLKQYYPVPSSDGDKSMNRAFLSKDESDSFSEEESQDHPIQCSCRHPRGRFSELLKIVVLVVLVVLIVINLAYTVIKYRSSDQSCSKQLGTYSPAYDAIEYYDSDWENAFDQDTPYRGPPTPDREQLWLDLWFVDGIAIPAEGVAQLNRSVDMLVEVPPEKGEGYIGLLEVFHQIHCLDLVRQYTWWLMGKYPKERVPFDFQVGDVAARMHADHCIETLRIALMCQSDVTPVLMLDNPATSFGKKADFNSHHRCRNYDHIKEWVQENGLGDSADERETLHRYIHGQSTGDAKNMHHSHGDKM